MLSCDLCHLRRACRLISLPDLVHMHAFRSHLTLEVALLTQPNLAFIGEEVRSQGLTLSQITSHIVDMITERHKAGLGYGVILIPEGAQRRSARVCASRIPSVRRPCVQVSLSSSLRLVH